jgi:hypothetical protein
MGDGGWRIGGGDALHHPRDAPALGGDVVLVEEAEQAVHELLVGDGRVVRRGGIDVIAGVGGGQITAHGEPPRSAGTRPEAGGPAGRAS